MKIVNTGIIRRIDDLGRFVIPKALRKELGIREEDALELGILESNGHKYFAVVPYNTISANIPGPAKEIVNVMMQLVGKTSGCAVAMIDSHGLLLPNGKLEYECELRAHGEEALRLVGKTEKEDHLLLESGEWLFAVPLLLNDSVFAAILLCGEVTAVNKNKAAVSMAAAVIQAML